MTTIILISVLAYVLPTFLTWNYMRILYSKNGEHETLDGPDGLDLAFTFTPILNLAACTFWLIEYPVKNKSIWSIFRKRLPYIDLNKFFMIKK